MQHKTTHMREEDDVDPSHVPIRQSKSRPTTTCGPGWGYSSHSPDLFATSQSVGKGPSTARPGNPISKCFGGQGGTFRTAWERQRVTAPAEEQLSGEEEGAAEVSSAIINPQLFNDAHAPLQLLGSGSKLSLFGSIFHCFLC